MDSEVAQEEVQGVDQEAEHEVEQKVEEVAEEEEADLAETISARAESTNQRISLSPKQAMTAKAKTKTNLWTNKTQAPQTATKKRHPLQKSAHTTLYFNLSNKSLRNPVVSAER